MSRIKRKKEIRRIPILGKVKVGEKVETGDKSYPRSLDYFKATGKYAELFHSVYGEKPETLTIVFISDTHEDSCDERYEFRDNTGARVAYGDGETWWAWSQKQGDYIQGDATYEKMESTYGEPDVVLTLKFILPKIRNVFGLWQFETKGKASSVPSIRSSFDAVQELAGTVVNIPFDLSVQKVKSQKPGDAHKFPVVTLISNISKENLETLHDYIEDGQRIKGMLTDDRIEEIINVKQIESPKED